MVFYFSYQPLVYVLKRLKSESHNCGHSTTLNLGFTSENDIKWHNYNNTLNTMFVNLQKKNG